MIFIVMVLLTQSRLFFLLQAMGESTTGDGGDGGAGGGRRGVVHSTRLHHLRQGEGGGEGG